jgi:hypothetical protein
MSTPYNATEAPKIPTFPNQTLPSSSAYNPSAPKMAHPTSYRHEAEKQPENSGATTGCYATLMSALGTCMGCFGAIPLVCCCPNPYLTISQGNVGLFSRFGK